MVLPLAVGVRDDAQLEDGPEDRLDDRIPERLPPDFVADLRGRGLRYLRRVPRKNATLEIGGEQSFGTTKTSDVERYLDNEGVTYYWESDDVVRFWFERPVFKTYRGEEIWVQPALGEQRGLVGAPSGLPRHGCHPRDHPVGYRLRRRGTFLRGHHRNRAWRPLANH